MGTQHHSTAAVAALPGIGAGAAAVLGARDVDAARERSRRRRLGRLALVLALLLAWLVARWLDGNPLDVARLSSPLPSLDPMTVTAVLFFTAMIGIVVGTTVVAGRSPHVVYRPEQIRVTFDDVVGARVVKEDVRRTLELFQAHQTFAASMGGSSRRGVLFEGAPGTGKTHMAKAMAREAGVPFLYVSATSFQSMYYGATARKIRSYFKALRKVAAANGGVIGFIEEIDAIGTVRNGMASSATPLQASAVESGCVTTAYGAARGGLVRQAFTSEGTGGVVNELLVQMQSFDTPTGWQRLRARFVENINLFLPAARQIRLSSPVAPNVLLIAATNRADSLDPALLRPGRFDRCLNFDLPGRDDRRELVAYYLQRKAHHPELDTAEALDHLAASTNGFTPVAIERLLDEALVNALRRGDTRMTLADVERARLVEAIGLGQPVGYTDHERRLIATHEAGHAVIAWLAAPTRRLEVLSIIKRRNALGMLAHDDADEVFTRSRTEMIAMIRIAMGGQAAEELFFGDVSTGPAGDLSYATTVACQMVGACGMDGSLVSLSAVQSGAFADTNLVGRVLGDGHMRERVEAILLEQKQWALATLSRERHLVEALRDALLARHELVGREIDDVLERAHGAPRPLPAGA